MIFLSLLPGPAHRISLLPSFYICENQIKVNRGRFLLDKEDAKEHCNTEGRWPGVGILAFLPVCGCYILWILYTVVDYILVPNNSCLCLYEHLPSELRGLLVEERYTALSSVPDEKWLEGTVFHFRGKIPRSSMCFYQLPALFQQLHAGGVPSVWIPEWEDT